MKLYIQMLKLLFNKFILRKNNGIVIKEFSEKMGIVYIKLAQMLATQNYGNLFTEADRKMLEDICDDCNKIPYEEIEVILKQEYGEDLNNVFKYIHKESVGSASVSQVHRAILKNGEEVALKIKRKDVTKTMGSDIERIRRIVHRFGKFVKFRNFTGGDHALDLYLEWIKQETDFKHEMENIKLYQNFADNVNGKVRGTKKIKIPKLYEKYCTENVIVMEFISTPTIKKMELTKENKEKIVTAFNSYVQSSFWAMFHDKQIVFHGDPHSGNICIDEDGNICFLDMGLLCALSDSDAKLCRQFFLTAYSGNYEKLYNMFVPYGNMDEKESMAFKADCKRYCEEVNKKDVTHYLIDMIYVSLKYELVPPDFFFNMAKAFVSLNGISTLSNNEWSTRDLLQEQAIEFLVNRSLNDCKDIAIDSFHKVPEFVESTMENGIVYAISKVTRSSEIRMDVKKSLENLKEMLDLLKLSYFEDIPSEPNGTTKRTKHL